MSILFTCLIVSVFIYHILFIKKQRCRWLEDEIITQSSLICCDSEEIIIQPSLICCECAHMLWMSWCYYSCDKLVFLRIVVISSSFFNNIYSSKIKNCFVLSISYNRFRIFSSSLFKMRFYLFFFFIWDVGENKDKAWAFCSEFCRWAYECHSFFEKINWRQTLSSVFSCIPVFSLFGFINCWFFCLGQLVFFKIFPLFPPLHVS